MRQLSLTHTIDGGAAGSNKLAAGTNGNNGTKRSFTNGSDGDERLRFGVRRRPVSVFIKGTWPVPNTGKFCLFTRMRCCFWVITHDTV